MPWSIPFKKVGGAIAKTEIGNALGNQWKDTLRWLMYNLVGGLIPVYGGFVLLRLYSKNASISDFTNNGEFALYSAALLAPSLYLIAKDYKTSRFAHRQTFLLICCTMLLFAMLFFAGVTSVNTGKIPLEIDKTFLRDSTLILFAGTVIICFLVTALDNNRIRDITEVHNQAYQDLTNKFDELQGD